MSLYKAETTRISIVLQNSMLEKIKELAKNNKMTKSEVIRTFLQKEIEAHTPYNVIVR